MSIVRMHGVFGLEIDGNAPIDRDVHEMRPRWGFSRSSAGTKCIVTGAQMRNA